VNSSWFVSSRDRFMPWSGTRSGSWVTGYAGHGSADWYGSRGSTHGSQCDPFSALLRVCAVWGINSFACDFLCHFAGFDVANRAVVLLLLSRRCMKCFSVFWQSRTPSAGASLNTPPPRTTTIGPQFWRPFLVVTFQNNIVIHLHGPFT